MQKLNLSAKSSQYLRSLSNMRRGRLIVIDGIDKVGKETQTKLLVSRLRKDGKKAKALHFPRYEENFFGALIGECIRGKHGNFPTLSPKIASVLYAADRFETKSLMERLLKDGYTIIADRYVTSNQIHQGGKIRNAKKRR
jgi:dTMP kinase